MSTSGHDAEKDLSKLKHNIHKIRTISPLKDDNWVTWKFEFIAALGERGLKEVVLEDCMPDRNADAAAFLIWQDQDESARAQIIHNLSPEVQPLVYDCANSHEMWEALRKEYESTNLDKIANVRMLYDTLPYIDGTPMRDHLNKLKILREQLHAMGDKIEDTSHALRMIRLLPPSWDGVCQVLRAIGDPSIQKFKDRLMAEEQSRQSILNFGSQPQSSFHCLESSPLLESLWQHLAQSRSCATTTTARYISDRCDRWFSFKSSTSSSFKLTSQEPSFTLLESQLWTRRAHH
jgi:hypothetical protein